MLSETMVWLQDEFLIEFLQEKNSGSLWISIVLHQNHTSIWFQFVAIFRQGIRLSTTPWQSCSLNYLPFFYTRTHPTTHTYAWLQENNPLLIRVQYKKFPINSYQPLLPCFQGILGSPVIQSVPVNLVHPSFHPNPEDPASQKWS